MKQKNIAAKLGVLQNSISRMESGQYFTSIPTLKKVCKILKCSSSDILGF
jgi:DNA-binding Xre family transcriptional regulator